MTAARYRDPIYRRARRAWAPIVAAGAVECSRCAAPIGPRAPWDLDHLDTGGLHPAHAACNRAAGARKRNAARTSARLAPGGGWSAR